MTAGKVVKSNNSEERECLGHHQFEVEIIIA
jgi:hypothetical protein